MMSRVRRREFLYLGLAGAVAGAEGPVVVENKKGGFRFLRGIAPYSSGAAALAGYEVIHAAFAAALPLKRGFEAIDRHLKEQGRPSQALCGIELRSPKPFTFDGFNRFNQGYVELLKQRSILTDGLNPVARTNVAPEVNPPKEPSLYGFSYTAPVNGSGPPTFVVAGAGELTGERLDTRDIVARGDVSESGLRAKAEQVLKLMEERLQGLGGGWQHVTAVEVYTVHNIFPLMQKMLLPRLGPGGLHGVRWHFARPPIEEIEFEMDVRGCRRELILG